MKRSYMVISAVYELRIIGLMKFSSQQSPSKTRIVAMKHVSRVYVYRTISRGSQGRPTEEVDAAGILPT